MNRTFAFAALLVSAATSLAAPPTNSQDVVVLSDVRPYRVRLYLTVDGKAYGDHWNAYLKRWFDYTDRNGDGTLDKEEAARVPSVAQFQAMRQGNPLTGAPFTTAPFDDLGVNRDGKVTLDEFTAYFAAKGIAPLNVSNPGFRPGNSDAAGEMLFKLLDTNGDGKLSQDEVARIEEVLRSYDANDDELVTVQELVGNVGFGQPPQPQPGRPATIGPLVLVPGDAEGRLAAARSIVERYDRDKDGKLSKAEFALPAAVFTTYDANRDGQIDSIELSAWLAAPIDMAIILRLGKTAEGQAPVEILAADAAQGAFTVAKVADDALTMTLADLRLRLTRAAAVESPNGRNFRTFYAQAFRTAAGEQASITIDDLKKNPLQFFVTVAPLIDRDNDGKITVQELTDYLDLAFSATEAMTSLSVAEQGRGLFEMLDANSDGRLSSREMHSAWKRLAAFDRDSDGFISREELPRQVLVTINPGPTNFAVAQPPRGVPARPVGPQPVVAARGPVWFRKMDLNGDGDVSRREWLGSPEEFRQIDTDGDGLISLDEAERHERRRNRDKDQP